MFFATNCSKKDDISIAKRTTADCDPPIDSALVFTQEYLYNLGFRDLSTTNNPFGFNDDDYRIAYYQTSSEQEEGIIKMVYFDEQAINGFALQTSLEDSSILYAEIEEIPEEFPELDENSDKAGLMDSDLDADASASYSRLEMGVKLIALTLTYPEMVTVMPAPAGGTEGEVAKIRFCNNDQARTCASLKLYIACEGCVNYTSDPHCIGNFCWRTGRCCAQ